MILLFVNILRCFLEPSKDYSILSIFFKIMQGFQQRVREILKADST